jgi:hypothetical protein
MVGYDEESWLNIIYFTDEDPAFVLHPPNPSIITGLISNISPNSLIPYELITTSFFPDPIVSFVGMN